MISMVDKEVSETPDWAINNNESYNEKNLFFSFPLAPPVKEGEPIWNCLSHQ